MLKLGSSKKWPEALKQVTGKETLEATAITEYFQPLYDWLVEQNEGEDIEWDENCPEGSITSSATNVVLYRPFNVFIVTVTLLLTMVR